MDFHLPYSIDELWDIFAAAPDSGLYAGGTDFLVKARMKGDLPESVICLERINELSIVKEFSSEIFIGACTTLASIMANPVICRHFPVLTKAVAQLGSPQIRNMGTIGGNVAGASPAGDTLPPLYVLKAEVELINGKGKKRMPIADFIKGPGKTALGHNEIISGIWIEKQPCFTIHHFEKVGKRNALAIAVVSMAACIAVSERGVVEKIKLAWGSAGPTVTTIPKVEQYLSGISLYDASTFAEAAEYVRKAVKPIDDVRAGASYRRETAGNLLLRLVRHRQEDV